MTKTTVEERLDALERDMATLKETAAKHFGKPFVHPEDEIGLTAEALAAASASPGIAVNTATSEATGFAPPTPADEPEELTKEELLEEAQRLDIHGRSSMSKDELAAAVAAHQHA